MIKGIEGRSGILRAFAALLMCLLANGIKSYFGKEILHDTKKVRNLLSVVLALLLCLGSLTPAFAAKNNVQADPDAELSVLDMANVDTLSGYLYERSQKNYDRLESDPYLLPSVLEGDPNWPGDYQGRALLGIISEAKANQDRAPQNLEAMMQALPDKLLDGCFFNETLNPDMINEQLMAGHSWFLRAMCELYEWNQDPRALEIIEGLVNKLLIPARTALRGIPLSKADRAAESPARLSGKRPVGSCPQIPAACLSCWTGQPTHIKLRKTKSSVRSSRS